MMLYLIRKPDKYEYLGYSQLRVAERSSEDDDDKIVIPIYIENRSIAIYSSIPS